MKKVDFLFMIQIMLEPNLISGRFEGIPIIFLYEKRVVPPTKKEFTELQKQMSQYSLTVFVTDNTIQAKPRKNGKVLIF